MRTRTCVGMVATIGAHAQPYLSPVYYAMGNDFEVYFLTGKNTHKAENIELNNKVAFSVGTGPEYISVMIRGTASIPGSEEEERAFARLKDIFEKNDVKNWPLRTLDDLKDQNLVLYKITPEKVTFLNMNSTEEPKTHADHLYHLVD